MNIGENISHTILPTRLYNVCIRRRKYKYGDILFTNLKDFSLGNGVGKRVLKEFSDFQRSIFGGIYSNAEEYISDTNRKGDRLSSYIDGAIDERKRVFRILSENDIPESVIKKILYEN